MPNDPLAIRHSGERLAALEERYDHLVERINHLDGCVDDVKKQILEHGEALEKNMQTWDRRWWVGLGFVGALMFLSGSGFVSLKSALDVISKIAH